MTLEILRILTFPLLFDSLKQDYCFDYLCFSLSFGVQ